MWDDRGDGYGMHDGAGAGFWVMLVVMLVLLIAVLAFLYLLATRSGAVGGRDRDAGEKASESAQRLLDERFARGEIDEDEYRRRRAVLQGA